MNEYVYKDKATLEKDLKLGIGPPNKPGMY